MNKKIRLGIIGIGNMGSKHTKNILAGKCPEIELCAVADIKQERLDALMKLQSEISLSCNQERIGSEIDVIVDDFTDGVFVCRSEFESPEVDGEILVKYDSAVVGDVDPYSLVGEFIKVRVTGADEYDLIAEIIEI